MQEFESKAIQARRDKFRKESIPKGYRWQLHILFNILLPLGLALGFGLNISSPTWPELMVIPMVFLFGTFAVWGIHKYPLHKKGLMPYTYKKHTVEHHSFFNHERVEIDSNRDLCIVLVNMEISIAFTLIYVPLIYFGLGRFVSANFRDLFIVGSALYFMLYEAVHTVCHLSERSIWLKLGPLKFMREHHRVHHNPKHMNKNYNIVYPLADMIFGTYISHKKTQEKD